MNKKSFMYWIITVLVIMVGFLGYNFFYSNVKLDANNDVVTEEIKSNSQKQDNDIFCDIKMITESKKDEYVKVTGFVNNVTEGKGHTFFYLKDVKSGSTIKVVLFRQENEKNTGRRDLIKEANQNMFPINIEGKVDVYENELEIIAKKVYQ